MIVLYVVIAVIVAVFAFVIFKNREIEIAGDTFHDEPMEFLIFSFLLGAIWIVSIPAYIIYSIANFIIKPKTKEDANKIDRNDGSHGNYF